MRYLLLFLVAGCSPKSADLKALAADLHAGSTLGAMASLGLRAASEATCATAKVCTTYPCTLTVDVTLGDGCAVPLDGTTGSVTLEGTLQSAIAATFATTFVGAGVVVSAHDLTVERSGASSTVSYAGQDVTTRSGVLAAQSSWTVVAAGQDTQDPSDDVLTLSGSSQGTGGAVDQIEVSGAVFDPSCRLNPVSGRATVQHVALASIQQAEVHFHALCDGKVDLGGSGAGSGSVALP